MPKVGIIRWLNHVAEIKRSIRRFVLEQTVQHLYASRTKQRMDEGRRDGDMEGGGEGEGREVAKARGSPSGKE